MRIVDGARLRDVMEAVKEISGGTDRKAARALGITQSTFTRLRADTERSFIQAKTFRKVTRGLRDLRPAPGVVAAPTGEKPLPFGLLVRFEACVIQGEGELALQRAGQEQFRASEEYKAWLAGVDEPDAAEGREPPGFWDDIL